MGEGNGASSSPLTVDGLSTRQLARTAYDGKIVTCIFSTDRSLDGYVCGHDTYHWAIVTPTNELHLLHKAHVADIVIGQSIYAREPLHDELERIVRPYRERMTREYFALIPQKR